MADAGSSTAGAGDGRAGAKWRLLAASLFAVYLVAGIVLYDDFGVTWDEELNREVGKKTYEYVAARLAGSSITWAEASRGLVAQFGSFFETILYAIERALGLEDTRDILLTRHLATFVAFWLGTVAFYAMLRLRFGDRRIALAGTALLVLTPRLFAHSFYNSKDAAMTAAFMIGMLTMLRFARRQSPANVIAHAAVCAAAVGIREVGLLLPAVTVVVLALRYAGAERQDRSATRMLGVAGAFATAVALLTVLFWPALWENPVTSLFHHLARVAAAKPGVNNSSLYFGEFVLVQELPWHYLPVWMAITIPPVTTLLFAAGVWASLRSLIRSPPWAWDNVQGIAFLLLFFLPFLAVVLVRPVLYDDWRHFYFIYPAYVAIAMTGLRELARSSALRRVAPVVVILAVVHGGAMLVRYHPYQNVYFNVLAGGDVESKFELDYWGSSFREGLEFVLRADPSQTIRVHASDYPGVLNYRILEPEKRSRIRMGPLAEADWFLSNHRQPRHYADFRAGTYPCVNQAYAVKAGGATLLGVYRLPDGSP